MRIPSCEQLYKTNSCLRARSYFRTTDDVDFSVLNAAVTPSIFLARVIYNSHRTSRLRSAVHRVPNVSADLFEQLLKYCYFHTSIEATCKTDVQCHQWDSDFLPDDPLALCSVANAAHFLEIPPLCDLSCKAISHILSGKTACEMRQAFHIDRFETRSASSCILAPNPEELETSCLPEKASPSPGDTFGPSSALQNARTDSSQSRVTLTLNDSPSHYSQTTPLGLLRDLDTDKQGGIGETPFAKSLSNNSLFNSGETGTVRKIQNTANEETSVKPDSIVRAVKTSDVVQTLVGFEPHIRPEPNVEKVTWPKMSPLFHSRLEARLNERSKTRSAVIMKSSGKEGQERRNKKLRNEETLKLVLDNSKLDLYAESEPEPEPEPDLELHCCSRSDTWLKKAASTPLKENCQLDVMTEEQSSPKISGSNCCFMLNLEGENNSSNLLHEHNSSSSSSEEHDDRKIEGESECKGGCQNMAFCGSLIKQQEQIRKKRAAAQNLSNEIKRLEGVLKDEKRKLHSLSDDIAGCMTNLSTLIERHHERTIHKQVG